MSPSWNLFGRVDVSVLSIRCTFDTLLADIVDFWQEYIFVGPKCNSEFNKSCSVMYCTMFVFVPVFCFVRKKEWGLANTKYPCVFSLCRFIFQNVLPFGPRLKQITMIQINAHLPINSQKKPFTSSSRFNIFEVI